MKHSRRFEHLHSKLHLQGFNRCLTPPAGHHNRRFEHLRSERHLQGFNRYLAPPVGGNLSLARRLEQVGFTFFCGDSACTIDNCLGLRHASNFGSCAPRLRSGSATLRLACLPMKVAPRRSHLSFLARSPALLVRACFSPVAGP